MHREQFRRIRNEFHCLPPAGEAENTLIVGKNDVLAALLANRITRHVMSRSAQAARDTRQIRRRSCGANDKVVVGLSIVNGIAHRQNDRRHRRGGSTIRSILRHQNRLVMPTWLRPKPNCS